MCWRLNMYHSIKCPPIPLYRYFSPIYRWGHWALCGLGHLSNFVWESRPWLSDSKSLIILFFLQVVLSTRAWSESLWVFACLVCVLIWVKPIKKDAVLGIHITKVGAAKTLGFLQECSTEGPRTKDASWAMSWRSSASWEAISQPISLVGKIAWKEWAMKIQNQTQFIKELGWGREGGNSKQQ